MFIPQYILKCIKSQVENVIGFITYQIDMGQLNEEEHITGALISMLAYHLNNCCNFDKKYRIYAKAFSKKEEKRVGADFAVILRLMLIGKNGQQFSRSKGFLAQAKNVLARMGYFTEK